MGYPLLNHAKKSKWKTETDGRIFTVASPATNPDLSFHPLDAGRGGFGRIR
jgi:hypothetical protein